MSNRDRKVIWARTSEGGTRISAELVPDRNGEVSMVRLCRSEGTASSGAVITLGPAEVREFVRALLWHHEATGELATLAEVA